MAPAQGTGSRGPYNIKPKPILPSPELDKIQNRDTSIVPRLKVEENNGQTSWVRVGTKEAEDGHGDAPVWMMPYYKKTDKSDHQLKFYYIRSNGKMAEADYEAIEWDEDIISARLFKSNAAKSRWANKDDRKREHIKWLIFVWTCQVDEKLPTTKITGKRKRDGRDSGASEIDSTPGTPASTSKPKTLPSMSALTSLQPGVKSVKETAFELWETWLSGTFEGINNDAAVKKLQTAYWRLHGREPRPSVLVLREAYLERLRTKAESSKQTQAWTQFRETQTGSKATVTLDMTDDDVYADRSMPHVKVASATPRIEGPPARPLPNPLPSVEMSWQICREWEARGGSEWDSKIDEVRAARFVLEEEFYAKLVARELA